MCVYMDYTHICMRIKVDLHLFWLRILGCFGTKELFTIRYILGSVSCVLFAFQSASVALANARRDMSFAGHKTHKPPHMDRLEK